MSQFNSSGSYKTTRENMMKAFDKLPKEFRVALADAVCNWVPQPYATKLKQGWDIETCVSLVRMADRREIKKTREEQEEGTYCLDIRIIQGKRYLFGSDGIGRPMKVKPAPRRSQY